MISDQTAARRKRNSRYYARHREILRRKRNAKYREKILGSTDSREPFGTPQIKNGNKNLCESCEICGRLERGKGRGHVGKDGIG